MQSVPFTTNVVNSNPVDGEVYSIQHHMIKFLSDLRQVCGFLRVVRFPPSIGYNRNIVESCVTINPHLSLTLLNYLVFQSFDLEPMKVIPETSRVY